MEEWDMPRKIKEEPMIEVQEDEVSEARAGVVMIDHEYYFRITSRQYVFGKKSVNKEGKEVFNDKLYPSTIEGVFKIYFKEILAKKSLGRTMEIEQLLKVVAEIKDEILAIKNRLEI